MRIKDEHYYKVIILFLLLVALGVFYYLKNKETKALTSKNLIDLEIVYDKDKKILVNEDDYGINVKSMDLTLTTK